MPLHVKVDGVWKEIVNSTTVRVGGAHRNVESAHVRAGGSWRTFYTRNTTGPAAPTNVRASWVNNGSCRVTWTNPGDEDYASMRVSWQVAGSSTVSGPFTVAAAQTSYTATNMPLGRIVTFFLTPVDTIGNLGTTVSAASMAWTGEARGRAASPMTFDPIDSDTWLTGTSSWLGSSNRVWQGSDSVGERIGVYWYGFAPYITLRGASIDAMSIMLYRTTANGKAGAVRPEMQWCASQSRATDPVTATKGSYVLGPTGMCRNGSCPALVQVTLPGSWYDNFFSPTASSRAFSVAFNSSDSDLVGSLGNVSESYMEMFAWNQTASGTRFPGRIIVEHGG